MTIFIRWRTLVMLGLIGMCLAFVWFSMSNSYFDLSARSQPESGQETGGESAGGSEAGEETAATLQNTPLLGEDFVDAALAGIIAQNDKNGSEFFSEYRLQRDRIRSQQIDLLREIVNNPNSVAETRKEAQEKLIVITQNLEREMELENLIVAKGFPDAIVLIQPEAVTIIVQGQTLTQEQLAKITDVTVRTLKIEPENIVIVPKP